MPLAMAELWLILRGLVALFFVALFVRLLVSRRRVWKE